MPRSLSCLNLLKTEYGRWYDKFSQRGIEVDDLEKELSDVSSEVHCRYVASALLPVSAFYGRMGVYLALKGDASFWKWMQRSARASCIAFKIKCLSFYSAPTKEVAENWAPNSLRVGLSSLFSLSVLSFDESTWLSNRLELGRQDGSVGAWDIWNHPTSRLAIALHRYLMGQDQEGLLDLNLGVYTDVFSAWNSLPKLEQSLQRAVAYHIQGLKSKEAHIPAEFGSSPFDLYPAEIIAIKRVRDRLGLESPRIEHPLTDLFLDNLPTSLDPFKDELLDIAWSKVKHVMPEV